MTMTTLRGIIAGLSFCSAGFIYCRASYVVSRLVSSVRARKICFSKLYLSVSMDLALSPDSTLRNTKQIKCKLSSQMPVGQFIELCGFDEQLQ